MGAKLRALSFVTSVIVSLLPTALWAAPTSRINVVFDINDVTISRFGPTPNFGAMLAVLLKDPRIHLYFFSTQSRRSIARQLQMVDLPDGRTADQIAEIFEGDDMRDFDVPKGTGHRYKDLRAIADKADLANTILVDDSFYKAHPTQLKNLLWLRVDLAHWSTPLPAMREPLPQPPKSWIQNLWRRPRAETTEIDPELHRADDGERNRRADLILGLLEAAIRKSDQTGLSVSDSLASIQWARTPTLNSEFDGSLLTAEPRLVEKLVVHGAHLRRRYAPMNACRDLFKPIAL